MRYFNYVVIIAVLVVSALLGRGYLGGGPLPALQADLKSSLDAFWQTHDSVVEVLGTPAQAEVRATVAFPVNASPRQQQWMNAFIPFVARRHPRVKLGSVRVVPLALEAKAEADSKRAPNPLDAAAQAEAAQRTLQSQLDSSLGVGKALILVDGQTTEVSSSNRALETEAPPSAVGGAPLMRRRQVAPEQDSARPATPVARTLLAAVLVVQAQEDATKGTSLVGPSLNGLRVVVLP